MYPAGQRSCLSAPQRGAQRAIASWPGLLSYRDSAALEGGFAPLGAGDAQSVAVPRQGLSASESEAWGCLSQRDRHGPERAMDC